MNKIQHVKENFHKHYIQYDEIESPNKLVHHIVGGCNIRTRSGIKTLIRMFEPKNILEIGSWHYDTTNQMALSLNNIHHDWHIDTFDIKFGGYDDGINYKPVDPKITAHFWMPHKTSYDEWKLTDQKIVKREFVNLSNDQIFEENLKYLKQIKPANGYDLVYIDGDHSYQGTKFDWLYTKHIINENALIIIDDIWDHRLQEVRNFFDDLKTNKWDFSEWNIANKDKVQNMGVCEYVEL